MEVKEVIEGLEFKTKEQIAREVFPEIIGKIKVNYPVQDIENCFRDAAELSFVAAEIWQEVAREGLKNLYDDNYCPY